MKVLEVIVHNYKSCCSDVRECTLKLDDKVTCLIGANESGKTNLLEAMRKFSNGGFNSADIPYLSPSCDEPDIPNDLKMVSVKYIIEEKDHANLSKIDDSLRTIQEITFTRCFKDEPYISYPNIEVESSLADFISGLKKDSHIYNGRFRKYVKEYKRVNKKSASSTNSVLRRLNGVINKIDSLTQSSDKSQLALLRRKIKSFHKAITDIANHLESVQNEVLAPLDEMENKIHTLPQYYEAMNASEKLWKLVPHFTFVSAEPDLWLKGEYLVEDLINKPIDSTELVSIRRLLELSDLDLEAIRRLRSKIRQDVALENASKKVTELLRKVWGQEKDIQIKFAWGSEGTNKLMVMVETAGHRGYPEERSRGFRWFLEFYLIYAATHHNTVLLFEEPGIHLHPHAQENLKSIMREKVAYTSQIVYTTHLPGMYDAAYPEGCRAVQKENGVTKVEARYSPKHQRSTWEVAMNAIGVSEPVVRLCKRNIITEGPADWVYLLTFARLLAPDEPTIGEIASGLIHIYPAKKS